MKRFEKSKRVLAFLLVTLMIISQSSVTILAEELSLDTRNAQNQEATAVAETPEESEQEPSVPDPDNNDKQEPEEVQPSVPEESPETTETLEPEKDTPDVLRRFATDHKVGPGWLFLTGKAADIESLRRGLGFFDLDPAKDAEKYAPMPLIKYTARIAAAMKRMSRWAINTSSMIGLIR